MRFIHRPRQTGKTTELMLEAQKHGGTIVAFSVERKRQLQSFLAEHHLDRVEVTTIYDLICDQAKARGRASQEDKPLYIDDIEVCMSIAFRGRVKMITMSKGEKEDVF